MTLLESVFVGLLAGAVMLKVALLALAAVLLVHTLKPHFQRRRQAMARARRGRIDMYT